mmetsp:Transcript_10739/g.29614  ORF Transcript_10739/g.29614 Transcript_10739/m.29614 type:complete len:447 (+) Transcript_10739:1075-2415(+)
MHRVRSVVKTCDGSKVGKWNSNKERQQSSKNATNTSRLRSLTGHTTSLKVQSGQVSKAQDKDGGPIPKESIWEGGKSLEIAHLVGEDALVSKGIGTTIISVTIRCSSRAPKGFVVAASIVGFNTGCTVVHIADTAIANVVRIDVAGETNTGRGRFWFVRNEPVRHNNTSRPANHTLNHICVRHREETSACRVHPNDNRGDPNGSFLRDIPQIACNGSKTDKVSSQEHGKGAHGTETDQNFDRLSISLGKDIGQGQNFFVVDVMGQKDSIEQQGNSQTNRDHSTIVEVVFVRQVNITQKSIRIDRLSTQGDGDNPERQRTASHEKVVRLSLDEEVGTQTNEERNDDGDHHSDTETISRFRHIFGTGQSTDIKHATGIFGGDWTSIHILKEVVDGLVGDAVGVDDMCRQGRSSHGPKGQLILGQHGQNIDDRLSLFGWHYRPRCLQSI